MASLDRYASAFLNGDANGQYQGYNAMVTRLNALEQATGNSGNPFVDDPLTASKAIAPPTQAVFSVIGIDGKFKVFITNPQDVLAQTAQLTQLQINAGMNAQGIPILHNLQSATDTNFNNASNLIDYGISSQLAYEVQDPNQTYFWRLRSSFDGQNWNPWQIFQDPIVCGPTGVWSGLLRSPALTMLNSQAQTVDGSNALTQDGTTTNILVAAKLWNVGPEQISYNGGSVDPGTFGTWYVYAIDTQKSGGDITYLATQNIGDLSLYDGLIAFGFIPTSGGGGGTGGGGGSCHVAGTMLEMLDGSFKDCSLILKGDELRGCDGGKEIAQADAEAIPNVPCFAPEFANGVKLENGVSSSEPIMLADGLFTSVFNSFVGQIFKTRIGDSAMTAKPFIGNRTVWRQRLSRSKTFWADRLGSHNMKIQ